MVGIMLNLYLSSVSSEQRTYSGREEKVLTSVCGIIELSVFGEECVYRMYLKNYLKVTKSTC